MEKISNSSYEKIMAYAKKENLKDIVEYFKTNKWLIDTELDLKNPLLWKMNEWNYGRTAVCGYIRPLYETGIVEATNLWNAEKEVFEKLDKNKLFKEDKILSSESKNIQKYINIEYLFNFVIEELKKNNFKKINKTIFKYDFTKKYLFVIVHIRKPNKDYEFIVTKTLGIYNQNKNQIVYVKEDELKK